MEHRSTSDLLRELQAITAERARRHGVGQPNGGEAPPGGSTASGASLGGATAAGAGVVHGGPPSTAWTGEPPELRNPYSCGYRCWCGEECHRGKPGTPEMLDGEPGGELPQTWTSQKVMPCQPGVLEAIG